jgi:hypothetical protein
MPSSYSHFLDAAAIANAVERAGMEVTVRTGQFLGRKSGRLGGCMTRTRLSMVVGLVSCSAMAAWVYAQTSAGPSGRLSPEDFLEIEQLVQGYTHGIDVGPEDASWVFTPDGSFVSSRRTVKGEKEVKAMYADRRKRHNPKQRHLLTNLIIKPTTEGAAGTAYITVVEPGANSMPTISYYGMYDDTYVRTPLGWRIMRREYRQLAPELAAGAQ